MKTNNILDALARLNPHLERLPGVVICENGDIAIFIKIRKVDVDGRYLSPNDYYSNFYVLDVSKKEIVKIFESDDSKISPDKLLSSPIILFMSLYIGFQFKHIQRNLKYSDISEKDFLKFKKLFNLYQVGKTNKTYNIIYNYCNSLLQ